ncbi:CP2-domain-containing protein [Basidiobolus meristosporus CBS 931.73]|uniref:CP2-domain-containing protein n=1 Tax=Basidiobolus meristosporus CBS 931.73 TaxID=1314790 RepID=A0A1Y1ZBT7_9FUNG|nr:CP2-domain-containing protein [Basidiobolus meristosporus CBS 931.73]|eukprot:ORY07437.1 CP2-domain-containing protein [Basidiobolus meristosporus CBS 931.73]
MVNIERHYISQPSDEYSRQPGKGFANFPYMNSNAQYGFQQHFQGVDSRQHLVHQYKSESIFPDSSQQHSFLGHSQLLNHSSLPSVTNGQLSSYGTPMQHLHAGHGNQVQHSELHMHQHLNHQSHYTQSPTENISNQESPFSMNSTPQSSAQVNPNSNIRFSISLEAQTAAAQRVDETPLTYLNKGQYYVISLTDNDHADTDLTSTLRMAFHDDTHRKLAGTYWQFWASQQNSPKTARALDIDKAASTGVKNVDCPTFDKVTFQWNGRKSAKIYVKFNCLSTDFSRIKGVKGIPLRITMETKASESNLFSERSFAKVKLFRDKGAERKNKDDQRHLEKIWEKMRGKQHDANPLLMMFAPVSQVTLFVENLVNDPFDSEEVVIGTDDDDVESSGKRKRLEMAGTELADLSGLNATYSTPTRKRRAVLCIYVKFIGENVHRAVYLERLTVQDLIEKLADKMSLQAQNVYTVFRVTSKGLFVRVDDTVISQMNDEQDMEVEYERDESNEESITLKLKF